MRLEKAVQPLIPVTLDIDWMEHQAELASLMGHGVAVLLPAHVCTCVLLYPKLGLWQTTYIHIIIIGPLFLLFIQRAKYTLLDSSYIYIYIYMCCNYYAFNVGVISKDQSQVCYS